MTALVKLLQNAMSLQGAVSGALIDLEDGDCIASAGNESALSLSLVGTVNARILRAKLRLLQDLEHEGTIEDMIITLSGQYHLIRLIQKHKQLPCSFFYLVLDRSRGNLTMARRALAAMEQVLAENPEMVTARPELMPTTMVLSSGNRREEEEEEQPAFMRDDVVMRLLGISMTDADVAA
jgi:hypothetical protein